MGPQGEPLGMHFGPIAPKVFFPGHCVNLFQPIALLNKTVSSTKGSLGGGPSDTSLPNRSKSIVSDPIESTSGQRDHEGDDDEEDLSYTIGEEEGLSLRRSVQDSDISETASEEEEVEGSDVFSVKTNTSSSFVKTTTTASPRRTL